MREATEQDFGERRRELAARGRQRCAAVREVDGQVGGVPEGQDVVVPGFGRGSGDRDLVGHGPVGEMLARPSERFQDLVLGTCARDGADGRCRRRVGLYPDGSRVEPVGNVSGVGDPNDIGRVDQRGQQRSPDRRHLGMSADFNPAEQRT